MSDNKFQTNKILDLLEHYQIKREVLRNFILETEERDQTFASILICALCCQEKMIIESFMKELQCILSDLKKCKEVEVGNQIYF